LTSSVGMRALCRQTRVYTLNQLVEGGERYCLTLSLFTQVTHGPCRATPKP
jgi:hypothetical protein